MIWLLNLKLKLIYQFTVRSKGIRKKIYQNIPANRETTYLKILLKNKKVFKYQIPRINIERQKLKKL